MKQSCKKTTIGGQALIEGLMMRGPELSAMGVRNPQGEILLETWPTAKGPLPWYKKTPVVRGIFQMADSQVTGFRCLMRSADLAGMEEEEPSRLEQWLAKTLKVDAGALVNGLAIVLGVGLALLLFMVLPTALSSLLRPYLPGTLALTLLEGLVKMGIFVIYLWSTSRMKEMRRIYAYHGAEHKTIACYEAGMPLTVENIRGFTRFHPRCGTSFVLIVLVISVMVFSLVSWDSLAMRILLKFLLLPVVVGIAYEIIKLAGRYDNPVTRFISAPGLWLQNLTTYEPEREMVEVAIAAMEPCIPKDGSDQW